MNDFRSIESKLDKNKFYCNICAKYGAITELQLDLDNKQKLLRPNCEHGKKNRTFYFLKWDEENEEWIAVQGLKINGKTTKETSKIIHGSGICYKCKKMVKQRGFAGLGIECGCNEKYLLEHNNMPYMDNARKRAGEYNANLFGKCRCNTCKSPEKEQKLNMVGFCEICAKEQLDAIHKLNNSVGLCTTCGKYSQIRNSFGVCGSCQAKTGKNSSEIIRLQIENGERETWPFLEKNQHHFLWFSENCNRKCHLYGNCINQGDVNIPKNELLYCYDEYTWFRRNNGENFKYRRIEYKFCTECMLITPHAYNVDKELYCQSCSGEKMFDDVYESWVTPDKFNLLIEQRKNHDARLKLAKSYGFSRIEDLTKSEKRAILNGFESYNEYIEFNYRKSEAIKLDFEIIQKYGYTEIKSLGILRTIAYRRRIGLENHASILDN